MMPALSFWSKSDEGRELSNFYPCKIKLEMYGTEYTFQNAEAAYQAHKMLEGNQYLFSTLDGKAAKELVKTLPHIDGWGELIKEEAMLHVLDAKFSQNDKLARYLISTAPRKLIHWAPWDTYWGWSKDNNGWNRLGELLMDLRDNTLLRTFS
jgi:ribA/ribD-fused uncharacterized protein